MKSSNHRLAGIAFVLAMVAGMLGGSMATQVVPKADGYDEFYCTVGRGDTQIRDIDYISFDSGWNGKVDFGDDPHLFGAPRGNAVVCWYEGRQEASVIGKVYWDAFDSGCGSVRFDFFDTSGHHVSSSNNDTGGDPVQVCSPDGGLRSVFVQQFATDDNHKLNRVRIRLYREGALVGTVNKYYGGND
jgi:hypothetical protein